MVAAFGTNEGEEKCSQDLMGKLGGKETTSKL